MSLQPQKPFSDCKNGIVKESQTTACTDKCHQPWGASYFKQVFHGGGVGICLLSRLLVTPVAHSSCPVYFPLNSGAAKTNHGHLTGPRDMAMWAAGPESACSGTALEAPEGFNARCQGAVCKSRADLAKEHGKHSARPVKGDVCLRVSWLWFCLADQFKASTKEKVKAFWSTKPCRHS